MEHYFSDVPQEERIKIALKCISDACKAAKNSLIVARNNVLIACSAAAVLSNNRNYHAALAGGLWAAVAAVVVAAAVTPWPFNLVLWIIAGVLAIAAAVASGYMVDADNKLAVANATLATAQQIFQDAVAAVTRDCDIICYGDLTVPTCP